MSKNDPNRDSRIPNEKELLDNLGRIAYTIDKTYLSKLNDYGVLPFNEYYNKDEIITYPSNIRTLKVERWVYDKDERIIDSFKNVLSVFSGTGNTLALVAHRTPVKVDMYLITKNVGAGRNEDSLNDMGLLEKSVRGNFPGTKVTDDGDIEYYKKLFEFRGCKSIAALSSIPSEKSDDYICQGIDKLLNGIVPKTDAESYFVVILADSLSQDALRNVLSGYQELATALTPFATYQFQIGENSTDTQGEMESLSHSAGISHSITKTHSVNVGLNGSVFASAFAAGVGAGASLGGSVGYGYSWGTTDTDSETDTKTKGTNRSLSVGTSSNDTYTYKSYVISNLVDKLEATIKRISESQATGLWKCASYVLAQDAKSSKNIASFLRSLSQGDQSYIEPSFIEEWSYVSENGVTPFNEIRKYLQHFCHPVFESGGENRIAFTPAMDISTTELSYLFAFPRTSMSGLPVVECARFGRDPHSISPAPSDLSIGCAYHMYQEEQSSRIHLSKNELTKHTFITGSTGAGKSNTIYKLLNEACKGASHFLVIEPAKGEYKDVFGGREDVALYGTNPFKTPNMLQINPFSFPCDVHVLEHIDRLVEVFNACWPMYAAMPAILREAIELAYEDCGWNLKLSRNPGIYPTFNTLLATLPRVVDSSGYSADTSNDYKGALVTRVRSLTRGIHGQLFGSDIAPETLFNHNTIVDLSRIGSQETKALIMGVLVLKLQEFRMSEKVPHNSELRHVTVLEEAHNLLRRTSNEQSQESSNLQGKSVEMLANAIAEMRTYGEGFIIADQSPGLMDMSVIRNTNTKIIMRLPDESDRQLVGKSAGLNDSQIEELSHLDRGVAAISQSGWLEPVLCKVDEFTEKSPMSERYKEKEFIWVDEESIAVREFFCVALGIEKNNLTKETVDKIRKWYGGLELSEKAKRIFELPLNGQELSGKQKLIIVRYAVGRELDKQPIREEASALAIRTIINKYDITNIEIQKRIKELFLLYYPLNTILESTAEQAERLGRE